MITKDKGKSDIKCKKCYSANIYTLKDGTKVCRKCGNRERIDNA